MSDELNKNSKKKALRKVGSEKDNMTKFLEELADYEEANKGGKGGGYNWGTNEDAVKTKEDAVKFYKEKYAPMVENIPQGLKFRALQAAINTGRHKGFGLKAAGYYDANGDVTEKGKAAGITGTHAANSAKADPKDKFSRSANDDYYDKLSKEINAEYTTNPEAFKEVYNEASKFHYANAKGGSGKTFNEEYGDFHNKEFEIGTKYDKAPRFTKTFTGASGNIYAHDPLTKETRVLDKGSKTWKPATEKEITNIAPYTKWEKGKSTTETPMDVSAVGKVDNTAVPQVNAPAYTNSTPPTNTITPPNNTPTTKEGFLKRAGNYLKSSEGKFAMSKAKDISFDAAMVAGQYANNKQALKELEGVRIPDAPQKSYLNSSRISMDVDRGANKTALANTLASSNRNFSDANVAAAMRGSATSQFQGTASKINQEERNVNTQLQQATNIANSGIQGENNTSILNKANLEMQKRLELIKGKQAANQQLLSGVQGVVAGEGAREKDRTQLAIDSATMTGQQQIYLGSKLGNGTTGIGYRQGVPTQEQVDAENKLALSRPTTNADGKTARYNQTTGAFEGYFKNGGVVKKLSKGGKMSKLYC